MKALSIAQAEKIAYDNKTHASYGWLMKSMEKIMKAENLTMNDFQIRFTEASSTVRDRMYFVKSENGTNVNFV